MIWPQAIFEQEVEIQGAWISHWKQAEMRAGPRLSDPVMNVLWLISPSKDTDANI